MTFFCFCNFIYDIYSGMPKSKKLTSSYSPYILPSDFNEMDKFIESHKTIMTEQVVASIEYALEKKLQVVEVFKFKSSDFVITLSYDSFQNNLENVYKYYIETEKYELCSRIKKLENQLNTISYKLITHEKK
jgi:hypothetical protein